MPVIEKRYAFALADICDKDSTFDQTIEGFDNFMELFNSNPEFNFLLQSQGIKKQIKKETLDLIKNIAPNIKNLVFLLLDKNRIEILPRLYDEFIRIANSKNNVLHMKIFSSAPIDPKELTKLKEIYKAKYNKSEVTTEEIIDKNLLGGIKIQIGDTVIDSTLKGRIDELSKLTGVKPNLY
jgi:F-type H+-transporting ATPase subunit delta